MHEPNEPVQPPTAPPPPRSETRRSYLDLDARANAFGWKAAKDGPLQTTGRVEGYLHAFWLEWDHGRPSSDPKQNVPARWNLRVALRHARTGEGETIGEALVTVGPAVPFYSLAEALLQVGPRAYVSVAVEEARNSCFVNVATWDGREWTYLLTPAAGSVPFEDRYQAAILKLKASALYDELETPKDPPEGATWRRRELASERDPALKARLQAARPPVDAPTSPPPVQTSAAAEDPDPKSGSPAPSAAGSAASAPAAAGGSASAPAGPTSAEGEEAPLVPPDPLPSAFGFQAPRWPKSLTKASTQEQRDMVWSKLAGRNVADDKARGVAEAVLLAYGLTPSPAGQALKGGEVTLVYDFAANATDAQLDQATLQAAYDPFADA